MEKLTITPAEAAKTLGVSKPVIYQEIHRDGGIPHIRVGRKILILRARFYEWINARSDEVKKE